MRLKMDKPQVNGGASNFLETHDSNIDGGHQRPFTSTNLCVRTMLTDMTLTILVTVILFTGAMVHVCDAQPVIALSIVRGGLLTIKGDTYVVREISGVLRYLRVDKNTQRARLIVPGEQIEAQVSPDGHILSIKPVH
jgi:hypothetical protein